MTTTQELRLYPHPHDLARGPKARHATAHGQYVCIIMFSRHACRIDILAQRRANPLDFVGGNRNADARAAEHDAAIRRAAGDIRTDLLCNIRIIH